MRLVGTVLNAREPGRLARFYEQLLGWERFMDEPEWVAIRHPGGGTAIAFQHDPDATPPSWPPTPSGDPTRLHLDFHADDVEASLRHAVDVGATVVGNPTDGEHVLLDPAGNPFCLIAAPTPSSEGGAGG